MSLNLGFKSIFPDAFWLNNNTFMPSYEPDRRIHFRREFEVDSIPERVIVHVTADARYTLYVNGQWVAHGPARGVPEMQPYDELDIAPFLKKGENVIAVLLYHYGISNYTYIFGGIHGFLFSGHIGELNLGSGLEWFVREAPGYIRNVGRCAGQYAFLECYDCRVGEDNWMNLDYQRKDDWYHLAETDLRLPGASPWTDFVKRSFPMPSMEIKYPELREQGRLISGEDWQTLKHLREYLKTDRTIWDNSAGGTTVFDFGTEVVGHLGFVIESPEDDIVMDYCAFEAFAADGHPDTPSSHYTNYGGRLYLKKGINRYELTMPWGLRAVECFDRSGGSLKISPYIRECIYPLDVQGSFNSNDSMLNRIWEICYNTQRHCMYDAYLDGPWREFAQWWGDALVQAANTFTLSTDDRLLVRGHEIVAARTLPNGLLFGVAPGVSPSAVLPDYTAIFLMSLYAHYWQTGSLELFRKHRGTALNAVNFFIRESEASESGIMPVDRRYWFFVDWCKNFDKTEAYNLMVVYAFDRLAELADLAGDEEVAERCRYGAGRIAGALELKDPEPHAVAFAILTGRFADRHERWKNEIILPLLASDRRRPAMPGIYFIYYFFEAAKILGCGAEVISAIRRWWGEIVELDMRNTPEHWPENQSSVTSRCHAWSAHPMVFFRDLLLGVRQAAPGWKKVIFDPLFWPDLECSGVIPTPCGNIVVENRKIVTVPDGITVISAGG